jgi:hypothetical protein
MDSRDQSGGGGPAARLRAFCFPGGEQSARLVRAVKTVERGEMRSSPAARWIPFAAEQVIDATASRFLWDAQFRPGGIKAFAVTDAYQNGHGWLAVKLAGVIPVKKTEGPEVDKGELQRYLASVTICPSMLLNHLSLDSTAVNEVTLRLRDRRDPTGAWVDVEVGEDGCPLVCRAERPRLAGNQTILTPWAGTATDFRSREGMRVATCLEVTWTLPEGPFRYYRSELTSFTVVR